MSVEPTRESRMAFAAYMVGMDGCGDNIRPDPGDLLDSVRSLLADGADPDGTRRDMPPLMGAVGNGCPEVVRCLLDAGADPRRLDANGLNALDHVPWEESWHRASCVPTTKLLLAAGTPLHDRDDLRADQPWPLVSAAAAGDPRGLACLLEHDRHLDARFHGRTILNMVCDGNGRDAGRGACVELLLRTGMDPDARSDPTPLASAVGGGKPKTAITLMRGGADPHAMTSVVGMSTSTRAALVADPRGRIAVWIGDGGTGPPPRVTKADMPWAADMAAKHTDAPWSMRLLAACARMA